MTDQNVVFTFSLTGEKMCIDMENERLEFAQGLNFIMTNSICRNHLDALAIENMIDVIEVLLEKLHFDYHTQRTAQSSDVYMHKLSSLFFNDAQVIDRVMLEHAFNTFIERIEYYVQTAEHDLKLFAYFVFVREMMHHLNVFEINIRIIN